MCVATLSTLIGVLRWHSSADPLLSQWGRPESDSDMSLPLSSAAEGGPRADAGGGVCVSCHRRKQQFDGHPVACVKCSGCSETDCCQHCEAWTSDQWAKVRSQARKRARYSAALGKAPPSSQPPRLARAADSPVADQADPQRGMLAELLREIKGLRGEVEHIKTRLPPESPPPADAVQPPPPPTAVGTGLSRTRPRRGRAGGSGRGSSLRVGGAAHRPARLGHAGHGAGP